MWGSRGGRDKNTVVCIACGDSVPRADAREYDKEGNRWERHDKAFEYLCKPCFKDISHQPRTELEALICEVEADGLSQAEFLRRYVDRMEEEYGPIEES